ncbi:peptide deformylase [Acetobacter sp. AN02]|uniref:peptide deformylase n=1 Tax=Acetobacter sp. AN02 TaxID=2894186 RepID=UPI0024345728|nr:peptide deformylase [Acetobacter sp. AN02]MDG6095361.1 peptide deformylase [Acetobacter sp. AN02]
MAILKIARMGHPVLYERAARVEDISSPEIQRLIDDMLETVADASGAGLAAPQVYRSLRMFVWRVPASRSEGAEDPSAEMQVLINPEITPQGDGMVLRREGCLSITGLQGWVPRYERIRYAGCDRSGQRIEGVASGFRANVMQHEMDHLDGILYPMRMTDLRLLAFDEEAMRFPPFKGQDAGGERG